MIQPQRGSGRATYTRAVPEAADPPLESHRRPLDALQRVTDAALAFLSEQELLDELLLRVTEILHTDTAAILLLDEDGTLLRARAARGIEEEVEQGVVIPVGKGFAGRIVAERATVVVDDVDHADILNPILREKGIRSLLGAPLLLSGRPLGVLHVGSLVPRRFTDDERDLLQLAADRAALAIEHARAYSQERRAREHAGVAAAHHRRRPRLPAAGRAAAGDARPHHRDPRHRHRRGPAAGPGRGAAPRAGRPRARGGASSATSGSRSAAASPAASRRAAPL